MRCQIQLGTTGWAVGRIIMRYPVPRDPRRYYATIDNTRYDLEQLEPDPDGRPRYRIPWDASWPLPKGAYALADDPTERTPMPIPAHRPRITVDLPHPSHFTIAVEGDRPVPVDVMRRAVRYVDEAVTGQAKSCAVTVRPVEGGWHLDALLAPATPAEFVSMTCTWEGRP